MTRHRWDDDDELLKDLAEAFGDVAPLSDSIARHARGAFAWRTVDSDLGLAGPDLDSLPRRSGACCGPGSAARFVVFTAAPLSVQLELLADRIAGQIVPPAAGGVVVESADGTTLRLTADGEGCFVLPTLPNGPVRLRCETRTARLVTDWVRL